MPEQSDLLSHLNQAQKEAVTHGEGPLLIVAGAGTGKTTVLTHRYVWLLREKNLKPENVLALTFTEKAAGEMEDRILQMLPNGTYDFWISTFHGFCQRILEEKGLEIGIPNRFRVLNETRQGRERLARGVSGIRHGSGAGRGLGVHHVRTQAPAGARGPGIRVPQDYAG
jgi:ATP-dependent exoDNAse (exonuclease V) beta subunit